MFVEQPLASPGSANKYTQDIIFSENISIEEKTNKKILAIKKEKGGIKN